MKEQILTMLELQDAMNSKVNPDWRNLDKVRRDARPLRLEMVEAPAA